MISFEVSCVSPNICYPEGYFPFDFALKYHKSGTFRFFIKNIIPGNWPGYIDDDNSFILLGIKFLECLQWKQKKKARREL